MQETLCSGTDLQDTSCLDGTRLIVRQRGRMEDGSVDALSFESHDL
jgi:hypothetical protein